MRRNVKDIDQITKEIDAWYDKCDSLSSSYLIDLNISKRNKVLEDLILDVIEDDLECKLILKSCLDFYTKPGTASCLKDIHRFLCVLLNFQEMLEEVRIKSGQSLIERKDFCNTVRYYLSHYHRKRRELFSLTYLPLFYSIYIACLELILFGDSPIDWSHKDSRDLILRGIKKNHNLDPTTRVYKSLLDRLSEEEIRVVLRAIYDGFYNNSNLNEFKLDVDIRFNQRKVSDPLNIKNMFVILTKERSSCNENLKVIGCDFKFRSNKYDAGLTEEELREEALLKGYDVDKDPSFLFLKRISDTFIDFGYTLD